MQIAVQTFHFVAKTNSRDIVTARRGWWFRDLSGGIAMNRDSTIGDDQLRMH